jgi:hypothetical protein
VLDRSVLAGSVLAGSLLAGSLLAGSVLAGSVLAGSVLAGSVLADDSPPRAGVDEGSAGPQRCPEPDASTRPGDQELAVSGGAAERSARGRCRGQDASGRGWDTLCSLPGVPCR